MSLAPPRIPRPYTETNGSQKVGKLMDKEWEIDGVHVAGDKTCIVQ